MSFLCCCCNNKSRKLTITDQETNPARTAGTFVQKQVSFILHQSEHANICIKFKSFSIKKIQPANGVRNAVSVQPGPTATKVYQVNRTIVKPVRVGSSHVSSGHSNHGYMHEHHTVPHTPLPTLPTFPSDGIDKNPEIGPDQQFGGTQFNVSSIGTPTQELELDTSQVIVDSSSKTEWKKPEGAIEIIPTVDESPMPSTSVTTTITTGDGGFGSSQVVTESLTKTESTEHEHFDKTTIDKSSQFIVGSSADNQITSTSAATGELTDKNEIVGIPIVPIIEDHKTETVLHPVENGQFGSSQTVVDSSLNTELKKTEGIEIIPSIEPTAPTLAKVMNDSLQSNQFISPQAIQSSTVTRTETMGQHSTQMISSPPGQTVYQSTNANPDINSQINQIVTTIIANESSFGKRTIEPIPSTSTVHVTEVHEITPLTTERIVTTVGPDNLVTTARIVSSADDELSEAFKDFVGGLMSTTPEAQKVHPIFNAEQNQGIPMDVTVTSTDGLAALPMDNTVTTTIEAAKDIISNEMAPGSTAEVEVIETIPSVVEVVTTQPTSTGYEETKVIATKFTSDGPTFLEVSRTGFHTDTTMSSSATELHSSQVISKSTFSYEDDQLISASKVFDDSSGSKNETSLITTTSSSEQQTFTSFTSFTEMSSSTTQHIVSSPDEDTFKSIDLRTSADNDGPTIVEIRNSTVDSTVETPPTSTTYIVSEPSYDRETSFGGSSSYSAAADSSYSYDDGGCDYSGGYDDD